MPEVIGAALCQRRRNVQANKKAAGFEEGCRQEAKDVDRKAKCGACPSGKKGYMKFSGALKASAKPEF